MDKARTAQVRQQLGLRVVIFGAAFVIAFGIGAGLFILSLRANAVTPTLIIVGALWLVLAGLGWLGPLRGSLKAWADLGSLRAKNAPGAHTTGVVLAKYENDTTLFSGPFQLLVRPQTQAMIITSEGESIIPDAEFAPSSRVDQVIERIEDVFSDHEHRPRATSGRAPLDHTNISKPRRNMPHAGQPFAYQAAPKVAEALLRPIRFDIPPDAFHSINKGDFVRIAHLPRTRLVTAVELVHRGYG